MRDTDSRVALVTGASRGIGARVAVRLAERGVIVAINYRIKGTHAEEVAARIQASGNRAIQVQADIPNETEVRTMVRKVGELLGRLDYLILNASGGLEKDKPINYTFDLNVAAQMRVVERAVPRLRGGGRIVFVTSHLAHFYGQRPVYAAYEPVAASKRAGEEALRSRIPQLTEYGISLVVVSGDLIKGTITPRLLARSQRGLIEDRRELVGPLPSVEEYAHAIVEAAISDELDSGATVFVGSTD
jgi:3-oxoacyl-[acyl-carrier protein] reductase